MADGAVTATGAAPSATGVRTEATVRADLEELLAREHGITHLTLQVDHVPDKDAVPLPQTDQADQQPHCEDSHGPRYRSGQ